MSETSGTESGSESSIEYSDEELERLSRKYEEVRKYLRMIHEFEEQDEDRVQIELFEHQVAAYKKLRVIMDNYFCSLHLSPAGAGKSWLVGYVSQVLKVPILVVGPAPSAVVWQSLVDFYQVDMIEHLSYQKLTGKKGKTLGHPFLTREDVLIEKKEVKKVAAKGKKVVARGKKEAKEPKKQHKIIFTITPVFEAILRKGAFIVFDEFQMIRNNNSFHKACLTISKAVYESAQSSNSRLMLLSGTPISDENKNIIPLLRVMNCIGSSKLVNTEKGKEVSLIGMNDLIMRCKDFETQKEMMRKEGIIYDSPGNYKVERIRRDYPVTPENARHICFLYYKNIIRDHISVSMPKNVDMIKDIANSFYKQDDKEKQKEMRKMLEEYAKENIDEKTGKFKGKGLSSVQSFPWTEIDENKLDIFVRIAQHDLVAFPSSKVILVINYHTSLNYLMYALDKFNPISFSGNLTLKQKRKAIAEFNGNPARRLWIGTLRAMAASISLHDKVGDSPRRMYISPSYFFLENQQVPDRIHRQGLKSPVHIRYVYVKGLKIELKILDSMVRRSEVLEGFLPEETAKVTIFPKDLKSINEDI